MQKGSGVLLDISRSLARACLPAPTGIDRVERAYIDWALDQGAHFLCRIDHGQYLVPPEGIDRFIGWLEENAPSCPRDWQARLRPWRDRRLGAGQSLIRRYARARALTRWGLAPMLRRAMPMGGVYINVGQSNLAPRRMQSIARAGLHRLVMIHDLIPLTHPQFTRDGTQKRFARILQAATYADTILCNSHDTAYQLGKWVDKALPPRAVLPLGVATAPEPLSAPQPAQDNPNARFLCLGTIEGRKNHTLLLDVWEKMWARQGTASPHLHIIGRRGWCCEPVFQRLDTSPMMGQTVFEHGALDDDALARSLAGARALLFPSFAEGYGLPLAEAMARGVPVIASDLPAMREIGGDVPEWLSPQDPEGWLAMILAYAAPQSALRAAQSARLKTWQAPGWPEHFYCLEDIVKELWPNP